ncbi:hypothetical protein BpHYR1_010266 [Brachionus plicatilis]|uniref:Uncharacterized protein n=1 Tax=Brachionus plicatilis TaxID=10195 RepID=A0A3M7SMK8_BRAPC|nr:hypothetical protein BpHYR1_010266 [Brachionus plicatilis]
MWLALKKAGELVYLVTAFVPSLTACLANSPVERPLCVESLDASEAILSKISLTKEFMMLIALLEMPVSG